MKRVIHFFGAMAVAAILAGCATTNNPQDPFENFNRAMFSFNDAIDQAALKPAAEAYRSVLPSFVQIGIGNFFGNLGDVWTAVNNMLQGKVADGLSDFMRFAVNSTLGLGGLLDIGSEAGMTKHKEDFGQTLGVWGVASGPYVVLPFLGSTTLRDSVALPVDIQGDLWHYKHPVRWRNVGSAVRVVDQRSVVLDATNLIEDAALDRYEFVRDAYMQRRLNNVTNGDAPNSKKRGESSSSDSLDPLPDRASHPMSSEPPAELEPESVVQFLNGSSDVLSNDEVMSADVEPQRSQEKAELTDMPQPTISMSSDLAVKRY